MHRPLLCARAYTPCSRSPPLSLTLAPGRKGRVRGIVTAAAPAGAADETATTTATPSLLHAEVSDRPRQYPRRFIPFSLKTGTKSAMRARPPARAHWRHLRARPPLRAPASTTLALALAHARPGRKVGVEGGSHRRRSHRRSSPAAVRTRLPARARLPRNPPPLVLSLTLAPAGKGGGEGMSLPPPPPATPTRLQPQPPARRVLHQQVPETGYAHPHPETG